MRELSMVCRTAATPFSLQKWWARNVLNVIKGGSKIAIESVQLPGKTSQHSTRMVFVGRTPLDATRASTALTEAQRPAPLKRVLTVAQVQAGTRRTKAGQGQDELLVELLTP